MKNIFLTITSFFISFSIFSQFNIDSVHYIKVEPLMIYKNGKEKLPKDDFLFHMTSNFVLPFGYASNKKSLIIKEKLFDGNCIIIVAEKRNLFKTKFTFSIPTNKESNFTITKKNTQFVSNKFNVDIQKRSKVVL